MIDRTLPTRPRANPKHGAWWDRVDPFPPLQFAGHIHPVSDRAEVFVPNGGELERGIVWLRRAQRSDRERDFAIGYALVHRAFAAYPDAAENAAVMAGAAEALARAAERERVIELPPVPATYEESTAWWRAAFYNSVGSRFE